MARGQRKVGTGASEIVLKLPLACQDERAAAEFLEEQRWGNAPSCPRCDSNRVYQMRDRKTGERNARFLWRCKECKRQYTVRIGTVLEDSRIPLRHWCYAWWAACASKKGVSALQIKRQTGLSYKSALFLMHRIRFAMAEDHASPPKLTGTVEADETYVGPKKSKPGRAKKPRGTHKTPVFAVVQRGGDVRAKPVADVSGRTLKGALRELVDPSARVITDEWSSYRGLAKEFAGGHETVRHGRGEYHRPGTDVHSNTVEGFFSLFKRGLVGTFHAVSKEHLHRYVAEFEFRYNTRKVDDGERVARAIRGAVGKRLRYREPAGGRA